MKNYEEKYTWEKENTENFPSINFLQLIIGLSRLIIFLPITLFFVCLFLTFKTIFLPLNLTKPVFFIRKLWSILVLRILGLKLSIVGQQSYSSNLFVSNHISWTDILVIQSAIDIVFVSKSEVRKMPGLGFLAKIANTVFIDRKPHKISEHSINLKKLIKKGNLICFFPEGTSTDGLRVINFKSGFFQILFDNLDDNGRCNHIVQPLSIFYEPRNKSVSQDFYGWWGSMSIISHIIKILCLSSGSVTLKFHKSLDSKNYINRKDIALAAENIISEYISTKLSKN